MRLTAYSDYTLRVLMYLGVASDRLVTVREISNCYGISKNHLMKIVQELAHLGVIETVRGQGGGIRLAKLPSEIKVSEIVRATEPDFRIAECFGEGGGQCPLVGACVLSTAFNEALASFLDVLEGYTLADLIKPRRAMSRRFNLDE